MPQPTATDTTARAEAEHEQPSNEDLLKDIPQRPPLPRWHDPELRYMPKTSDEGQPPATVDEAWRKINNLVEKYDKGLCESYREQIDTLLVFAGLFSAVVTAFAVESYQWLQDDPMDASAELLRQAVSVLSALANQTSPAAPRRGPSLSDSVVVRINVYWFLSLVLSLSAALVGIVCKQWLREYERDVSQSAERALGVRQMKFQGLDYWRVGAIVTSVPLLLQVALALFLIGISDLLWHLHRAVALAVTITGGFTAAFYILTAILPVLQYIYLSIQSLPPTFYIRPYGDKPGRAFDAPQCPYKSPQAWLTLRLFQPIIDYIMIPLDKDRHHLDSWVLFDKLWAIRRDSVYNRVTTTFHALAWAALSLEETHLNAWILLCARRQLLGIARVPNSRHLLPSTAAGLERIAGSTESADSRFHFGIKALLRGENATTRAQIALFLSSCRSNLDVNTSVELLTQVTTPFTPARLALALRSIILVYMDWRPRLGDDLAVNLLQLGQATLGQDLTFDVTDCVLDLATILAWAPSRMILMPVLCNVVFQWLQTALVSTGHSGRLPYLVPSLLHRVYDGLALSRDELHRLRGFDYVVTLARFMLEKDPQSVRVSRVRYALDKLGLEYLYDPWEPQYPQADRTSLLSEAGSANLFPSTLVAPPLPLESRGSPGGTSIITTSRPTGTTEVDEMVARDNCNQHLMASAQVELRIQN